MGPSKRRGSVRRQVLDLNTREDSPSRPTWQTKYQNALPEEEVHQNGDSQITQTSTIPKTNPLSGLLGNYNSDSDSEESAQKPASSLDAKVEDFLKEIQSISVESSSLSETVGKKAEGEVLYPPSVTAWQQCYDHNSGYPYYWNTETNEVTWEMPADLKAAIANVAIKQQQQQQQSPPKPQAKVQKAESEVPKKVVKYPWQTESDSEDEKIEMITSFGPQSGEESEGEDQKMKTSGSVGSSLPAKSLSYINSSKIISDCITLAPEDPEGLNETSYETSSLLTHGVQDTGPPGDESFNSQKRSNKVPASTVKEEPVQSKSENSKTLVVVSKSEGGSTERSASPSEKKPLVEEPDIKNLKEDIADDVIAQIEMETPPDYEEDPKPEKQIENSQITSGNSATSSLNLVAIYGDDSESEDNSVSEKRKSSTRSQQLQQLQQQQQQQPPKPLFPIEIPQEKVKPLFPCMGAELIKVNIELKPKEPVQDAPEPVSNIYNTEIDDPAVQKAFKRKKRIEFATTVYGPSTSKAKTGSPERAVSVPTTQYNLDPNSNEHHGFGFNANKALGETERKTYKNYGGIQFVKAETMNLNAVPEPKEKCETETDNGSAPRSSSKETVRDEEIEDAASLLREKVTFLTGGTGDISPIQQMAIELETLVLSWQHGALNPPYLLRWLKEKCSELIRHEKTAAPPGWTCLWDRKSKRYYYRNSTTKAIQWEYPSVEEKSNGKGKEDVGGCGDEMDICDTPPHLSPAGPEKSTDETPSTPPPPVISDVSENVSPPSPTPQPPPPPQISFGPENESSSAKIAKKKKRKAEEISTTTEVGAQVIVPPPEFEKTCETVEGAPPLPPMPPPPPPPPEESPPPLPDSPPPLPLDPDQPLPPGVDEPEYALYRAPKQSYKKSQAESAAYPAELMMTYGYGLPVQQVVSSNGQAMAMQMQPIEYHTYMHEPVANHYIVQSAPTSHVIHCPAKKPKPSITSELVSFYSDLALIDSSSGENSNSQTVPSTPAPPPQEPPPAPAPVPVTPAPSTKTSLISSSVPTPAKSVSDSVTSNGVEKVKKKKKTKTTSALSLKKKGVSSLVAKWQQVQQEVRRDFSDDDDDAAPPK